MRRRGPLVALLFVAVACSDDPGPAPTDAGAADATVRDGGVAEDAGVVDAGPTRDPTLARLTEYLLGDFDNQAQHDDGFPQLVERHVCPMPGFDASPDTVWLYVEHVEHVARGRDAYFIRVNELQVQGDEIVSRAYRFPMGHTLRTDAFSFNGPRDACFDLDLIGAVDEAALDYRAGCDVTFTAFPDRFEATSAPQTCTFPGGYIQTMATVREDSMTTLDRAVSGGTESGSTFEFVRVDDFVPPG
jgi:hypothetical protein